MATPGCSPVPVEKRRYHRRALPIFDRSSKVAMSVNCEALPPSEVADESCKRHKQKYPLSLAPCSHINQSEISLETRKQREGVKLSCCHRKELCFLQMATMPQYFHLTLLIFPDQSLSPHLSCPRTPHPLESCTALIVEWSQPGKQGRGGEM